MRLTPEARLAVQRANGRRQASRRRRAASGSWRADPGQSAAVKAARRAEEMEMAAGRRAEEMVAAEVRRIAEGIRERVRGRRVG